MPIYKHTFTIQQDHYAFVSDDVASQGKAAVLQRLKQLHEAAQTFVLNGIEEADGVWEEVAADHPPQPMATPVLQGTWEEVKDRQMQF